MITIIPETQCNNILVEINENISPSTIIINEDGIVYYKKNNNIIMCDSNNNQNNITFDSQDKIVDRVFYKYNKPYFIFECKENGFWIEQKYFFKGTNRAICQSELLRIDEKNLPFENKTSILSREQLENYFNKEMYYAMYMINLEKFVEFAYNKTNGLVLDKKIIPSDEEIIKLDLEFRKEAQRFQIWAIESCYDCKIKEEKRYPRLIHRIKNLKIYGGLFKLFNHLLITNTNGKLNIQLFNLEFVSQDTFKLTTKTIPLINPSIDDVIDYFKVEDDLQNKIDNDKSNNQKVNKKWFKNI